MDTDSDCSTVLVDNALSVKREWNKSTAQRLTDNGAGADNTEAVSAPKPQHAPVRTTPCQQPANKGTTSAPLNVENEPLRNRDSSHSQLDGAASVQEKALPQPVSPLSSAAGKGFALRSPSGPLGKDKELESWPRERRWGWAPSSGRTQTPAGERGLPGESSLIGDAEPCRRERGNTGSADYVTRKEPVSRPRAVSLSDRGARPGRALAGCARRARPCCRALAGTLLCCQAVQNGHWPSSTTFSGHFFLLSPNPVHIAPRRGFACPAAAAGDARLQKPLLPAEEGRRAGWLVGRVPVGLLLNSPKRCFQEREVNAGFELQKSG